MPAGGSCTKRKATGGVSSLRASVSWRESSALSIIWPTLAPVLTGRGGMLCAKGGGMATRVKEAVNAPNPFEGYSEEQRPLSSYAALTATWMGGFLTFAALVKALRRPIPILGLGEIAL